MFAMSFMGLLGTEYRDCNCYRCGQCEELETKISSTDSEKRIVKKIMKELLLCMHFLFPLTFYNLQIE